MSLRVRSMSDLPPMHRSGTASHHAPKVESKYGNKWCIEDGERFDSKLEARCYRELKLRRQVGEVLWFIRQVPFNLAGVRYRADFLAVLASGGVEVIDAKGFMTDVSRNKIKQMKSIHGIDVQLWGKRDE